VPGVALAQGAGGDGSVGDNLVPPPELPTVSAPAPPPAPIVPAPVAPVAPVTPPIVGPVTPPIVGPSVQASEPLTLLFVAAGLIGAGAFARRRARQ
jgi:hypothetical protein